MEKEIVESIKYWKNTFKESHEKYKGIELDDKDCATLCDLFDDILERID